MYHSSLSTPHSFFHLFLTLLVSQSHTQPLSLSLFYHPSHLYSLSYCFSLTLVLSLTEQYLSLSAIVALIHYRSHSFSLSLSHSFSLSLTRCLSHTHSLSLFLVVSLSHSRCLLSLSPLSLFFLSHALSHLLSYRPSYAPLTRSLYQHP